MTSTSTTVPAVPDVVFTDPERMALAGFLAGYRGLTRDAYALDLRQFLSFCERHGLRLFSVRRTDIELYARGTRGGWPRPGHRGSEALHGCRLLSFRRGGGAGAPPRRQSMSAVHVSTMSRTRSALTATRSVRS